MSERLTVEASLREYLASHPTRRVTLDAREAGLLLADLTAARARAEAAEAKVARVRELAEQWGSWESPHQPPLIPRGAASRLRAALADSETEAPRG